MKRGTGRHEKLLELACELSIPLYAAVGIMNLLWEWAAESKPRGDIGRASNRVIATMVGWPVDDCERLIQTLVQVRLVDAVEGADRLVIHDWADHCDNGVHTYLARRGLYFACGKPPSLNHLRGDERSTIAAQYGSKKGPKKVQGKSKQKHGGRTDGTAPASAPVPSPASAPVTNSFCPDPATAGLDLRQAIGWTPAGGWVRIGEAQRKAWAAAYPSVDIDGELAKANAWLLANPTRAGKRNWARFLNTWLGKAHERGPNGAANFGKGTGNTAAETRRQQKADREFPESIRLDPLVFHTNGAKNV